MVPRQDAPGEQADAHRLEEIGVDAVESDGDGDGPARNLDAGVERGSGRRRNVGGGGAYHAIDLGGFADQRLRDRNHGGAIEIADLDQALAAKARIDGLGELGLGRSEENTSEL